MSKRKKQKMLSTCYRMFKRSFWRIGIMSKKKSVNFGKENVAAEDSDEQ